MLATLTYTFSDGVCTKTVNDPIDGLSTSTITDIAGEIAALQGQLSDFILGGDDPGGYIAVAISNYQAQISILQAGG